VVVVVVVAVAAGAGRAILAIRATVVSWDTTIWAAVLHRGLLDLLAEEEGEEGMVHMRVERARCLMEDTITTLIIMAAPPRPDLLLVTRTLPINLEARLNRFISPMDSSAR
jgi:hypothetical protein